MKAFKGLIYAVPASLIVWVVVGALTL